MPKKKKGTTEVEKESNDPIKTIRKEKGVAGINVCLSQLPRRAPGK